MRTRVLHYSSRTEDAYADRARRFILFHGKRHPRDMGVTEVEAFLTRLAMERGLSVSTQNQAKAALLFYTAMCCKLICLDWVKWWPPDALAVKYPGAAQA